MRDESLKKKSCSKKGNTKTKDRNKECLFLLSDLSLT